MGGPAAMARSTTRHTNRHRHECSIFCGYSSISAAGQCTQFPGSSMYMQMLCDYEDKQEKKEGSWSSAAWDSSSSSKDDSSSSGDSSSSSSWVDASDHWDDSSKEDSSSSTADDSSSDSSKGSHGRKQKKVVVKKTAHHAKKVVMRLCRDSWCKKVREPRHRSAWRLSLHLHELFPHTRPHLYLQPPSCSASEWWSPSPRHALLCPHAR